MTGHSDWTLIDRGEHCGLYRHRDGRTAVLHVEALRYDRHHDAAHPPLVERGDGHRPSGGYRRPHGIS